MKRQGNAKARSVLILDEVAEFSEHTFRLMLERTLRVHHDQRQDQLAVERMEDEGGTPC
jgi:hypothetical protein